MAKPCYKPIWGPILCDYCEHSICIAPDDIYEQCKKDAESEQETKERRDENVQI